MLRFAQDDIRVTMNTDKKKVLGRGLETLIPAARASAAPAAVAPATESGEVIRQIPVDQIERNPYQTRHRVNEIALAELTASVRASGIMQPIVVRQIAGDNSTGKPKYHLIAGERRWLAAKKAGLATVPAIVRQCSNEQAMELTIIENLQREDLNPMEQALAFDRLAHEFGLTQEQIAQKTGKDRATIANYLRLLRLPMETRMAIQLGQISFGHAKVMLTLDTPEKLIRVTKKILEDALSVRQTEDLVFDINHPIENQQKPPRVIDPNVREAEKRLQQVLGARVRIKDRRGRGKVVIEYNSLDDFDRILEALGAGK